jgi:Glycosyltransferase family 87
VSLRRFDRARLARDGLRVAGIIVVLFVWWLLSFHDYQHDARAYWASDLSDLYARGQVGGEDAYLYSPAFAQLFAPLTLLPWGVFAAMWAALNLGALVWMTGPAIAAVLLLIPGSPVVDEVGTGNIHLLLAAAIVLAFRYPAAWAFPLLTKVTPGIGLLWLAGARQWRAMAIAVGATALISLVSFALTPGLWADWLAVLTENAQRHVPDYAAIIPGSVLLRTAIAAVLAVIGGALGWRFMVPAAATLALPVPWSSGLSVLVAIVALARRGQLLDRAEASSPDRGPVA